MTAAAPDSEDGTGEAFRCATIGHGDHRRIARPRKVQVNELHQLANLLFNGYSGFRDAHAQMQIDYYEYPDSRAL